MLRRAAQSDLTEIEAVLKASTETTLFLRGNLQRHGLDDTASAHGMQLYVSSAAGAVGAIFAVTNNGYLLAHTSEHETELWAAFADMLRGRVINGMTGHDLQVLAMMAALKVPEAEFRINEAEPLYRLDLGGLVEFPDDVVRAPERSEIPELISWRMMSTAETVGVEAGVDPYEEAKGQIERFVQEDVLRVLVKDGLPVSMTAFNAVLPDVVQVGGVFTPAELRGHGYARRAVSGHLREAKHAGVETGILFSANAAASRAYEGIGFQRIGAYRIALFRDSRVIGETK